VTRNGRYNLIVQDANGCEAVSKPVRLKKLPNFKVGINALSSTDLCAGDSVVLQGVVTGGISPYTYAWKKGSTVLANTTDKLVVFKHGGYKLKVTDSNGCQYGSPKLRVNPISCRIMNDVINEAPKEEVSYELEIKAYPNPFRESINVEVPSYSEAELEIRIFDLYGRKIFGNTFPGAYDYEISVKGVDNGYYILEVIQGSKSGRVKILKQE
ncbi:MAG: T9SS type A sorting domain-containing protein, partial [Bacteroidia bacterium]|nr:T9SS type A sorting domain-containing protein [Bacteroidia bacterium]